MNEVHECMKKKKGKAKCDLKVMVPVVAGLGKALLPNLNLVDHQGTHLLWPLSDAHCYYPPK